MASRTLTDGEVKALFASMVTDVGGQEATAVRLGVSRQRVAQLASPNYQDMPTLRQVMCLECVLERPVITSAAARAIQGEDAEPLSQAVVEAVGDAAGVLRLVSTMDAKGKRGAADVTAIRKASQDLLKDAERVADAAAALQPGRCA